MKEFQVGSHSDLDGCCARPISGRACFIFNMGLPIACLKLNIGRSSICNLGPLAIRSTIKNNNISCLSCFGATYSAKLKLKENNWLYKVRGSLKMSFGSNYCGRGFC